MYWRVLSVVPAKAWTGNNRDRAKIVSFIMSCPISNYKNDLSKRRQAVQPSVWGNICHSYKILRQNLIWVWYQPLQVLFWPHTANLTLHSSHVAPLVNQDGRWEWVALSVSLNAKTQETDLQHYCRSDDVRDGFQIAEWRLFGHPKMLQSSPALFRYVGSDSTIQQH